LIYLPLEKIQKIGGGLEFNQRLCRFITPDIIFSLDQRKLTVRSGSARASSGGQSHQVLHINVHLKYDDYYKDYDVAVLDVATPFRYDDTTQIVKLATVEPADGSTATVTGWGRTSVSLTLRFKVRKYLSGDLFPLRA